MNQNATNMNPVERCFSVLQAKKGGLELSGGNCGQTAYAVQRFLHDRHGLECGLGFLTDSPDEEDIVHGEPNVYHVYVELDGDYYDEYGLQTEQDMVDLASDQYGDHAPLLLTLEWGRRRNALMAISRQTDYDTDWNTFYGILEDHVR